MEKLTSMSEDDRRNQMVSDIIDEMDKDQNTKKFSSSGSIALKQVEEDDITAGIPEDSGFIKKYTDKQVEQKKNEEQAERMMSDAIAGKTDWYAPLPDEQPSAPKGLAARFEEKLKEEEKDNLQASKVVNAFEKASTLITTFD